VKQAAEYLHLNEKKVYALVSEGRIPGTKVTGKWMFPRELIDRWMLESSHGGLLTDRLVLAGSDDPLLYRVIQHLARDTGARGLVSYTATGTRLGLELLQAHRADACGLHWGPSSESHLRHPALLSQFPGHRRWVMIRAFRREQGLMLHPSLVPTLPETHVPPGNGNGTGAQVFPPPRSYAASRDEGEEPLRRGFEITQPDLEGLLRRPLRWAMRQEGAGAKRFFQETLRRLGVAEEGLEVKTTALSEREAAVAISLGDADIAPGARSAARENGLAFVATGWESFDLALERGIYFRQLFQNLMARLSHPETASLSEQLGGYDMSETGRLVWGQD
jgi:excisionase family DNA binding protein